ncbi:VWA domain-containing protein [Winogradskyella aquimaris]|uniref:VWA domain-containing protein n=1 Tax=Winogradskyella aquimaris TaxID=864074 RepID=A0ABU5EJT1_9FLAO|nr:VWA domain-containing protein [Winogradskyella aquimaris]MDY2586630.1 VWA domain-containing protein [Winogradskyella aquimaris]
MTEYTLIYITLAFITALFLALFQYVYKSSIKGKLRFVLSVLRTLSLFGILLLLINPKFETKTFYTEKPTLVIAVDDSESVTYLEQDQNLNNVLTTITTNSDIQKRFNIKSYSFGKSLKPLDSLSFSEQQSNISETLKQLGEVYNKQIAPIILLSDGNQTYGSDYSFISSSVKQPIYPLILGDTTVYTDLSIKQLNVNRYAFLKNRFPVEIIANYNGAAAITTELKILSGNSVVYSKPLKFDATKKSEIITTTLLANAVGVKTYSVELTPLDLEKNTVNNSKNFGVEVIDQKTNIAIVSDILHPDLGTLKKAIESNEQRSATILKPSEYLSRLNDFQLVILYQPNNRFNTIMQEIVQQNLNTFIITGKITDFAFLNNIQSFFKQTITNQIEDFQPTLNRNYNIFSIDNLDFYDYPPLQSEFGSIEFSVPNSVILSKTVNGIDTGQPMLSTYDVENSKHALLSGEGIWRWRAQSYLNSESFDDFDNFIGKLVQYLSSNKKRSRLELDYKSFYNGNDDVIISAQYFNKSFEFDDTATLTIVIKNKSDDSVIELPLLLSKSNYNVDLSGMASGAYDFTVKHNTEAVAASGSFEILEFKVEQQFLNADIDKLQTLARNSGGSTYYFSEPNALISDLLNDNRYATIQKSTKNIVPLIDWKYLLGLIALSLFAEWFLRKYNGLI